MKQFEKIQNAIVCEYNRFGDYSVHGDDLRLAAAMAILQFIKSSDEKQEELIEEMEISEEVIMIQMPNWVEETENG